MKIDSTKPGHQIGKEEQVKKPNSSKRNSDLFLQDSNSLNRAEVRKDFATILKNVPFQNEKNLQGEKSQNDLEKNNFADKENESRNIANDKEKFIEQKKDNENARGETDSKEENTYSQVTFANQQRLDEVILPTARAIVHVADLERIIATIRSQSVAGGKQIIIELKRSVMRGLKLKLTIGKNKGVIAELITTDNQVKNQLDAKAGELANLLKDRGIKLDKLELTLSSDANDQDGRDPERSETLNNLGNKTKANYLKDKHETISTSNILDSDTSYRT